jgi:leader peptidase (prepilin peptidase) / N-methyltransferase
MTIGRAAAPSTGVVVFILVAVLLRQPPLAVVRFAILGAALGAVVESDLVERRIPNRIVTPAATACAATLVTGDVGVVALVEGLVLAACMLVLALIRPEALGMGDVKLALLLVLGLDGRAALALLVTLALAAGFGLVLLVRSGRAAATSALPLAPFFAAGALIAVTT